MALFDGPCRYCVAANNPVKSRAMPNPPPPLPSSWEPELDSLKSPKELNEALARRFVDADGEVPELSAGD
jgi:hypothetical protein